MEGSIQSLKRLALGRRVFISHAREDAKIAARIALAIRGRDCTVFLDEQDLPPGGNYEARIYQAIQSSSVFVFLISPASVSEGRYPLTELKFAEQKWPHPADRVLPVLVADMPIDHVPEYLRAASVMKARGDLAAEVAAAADSMLPRRARLMGAVAATVALAIAGLVTAYVWPHGAPVKPEVQANITPATTPQTTPQTTQTPTEPELPSEIKIPPTIELKFTLDLLNPDPNLSKDQVYFGVKSPQSTSNRRKISLQDEGFYVPDKVTTPRDDAVLYAGFSRSTINSQLVSSQPPYTVICLRRSRTPPRVALAGEVILRCKEGDQPCDKFDQADPGWFEVSNDCPSQSKPRSPAGLWRKTRFASLFATDAAAAPASPTWIVPSLETLTEQKSRNQLRDGFTTFSVAADADTKIDADAVSLDLRVNDTPILIEGLPADLQARSLQAGEPLRLTFGLQNLNFDGRYNGCDRIEAKLLFYKDGVTVGAPVILPLYYAALRDAARTEISTGQGKFTWSASYELARPRDVKARNQEEWRLFLTSRPLSKINEIQKMREDINRLNLVFNDAGQDYPVVAVVRPPLLGQAYGLALGLVQPSGQIEFTFGPEKADRLRLFAIAARQKNPAARNVISDSPNVHIERANTDRHYTCAIPR
jgi:hypothetical protein